MKSVDLNADIGEGTGPGYDDALLDIVTSASIACGGHAGDSESMERTVLLATAKAVRIGAHPSFPDRQGFGRRDMHIDAKALIASLKSQVGSLSDIAAAHNTSVAYIKPHGALYNEAAKGNNASAEAVLAVAREFGLMLMMLAGSPLALTAAELGVITEGFIDRGYASDGSLLPRSHPEALISDPLVAAEQAVRLAERVDSLCIHSDSPNAIEIAKRARSRLVEAGYTIGW